MQLCVYATQHSDIASPDTLVDRRPTISTILAQGTLRKVESPQDRDAGLLGFSH